MFGEKTIMITHGFNCYFKDIKMTDVDDYETKEYCLSIEKISKVYGDLL